METNNDDSKREDRPRDINPNESGHDHPAKDLKAQQKIGINESGLGREQGQDPADEHIENSLSQIDKGTLRMHDGNFVTNKKNPGEHKEINEDDNRDEGDSTKDWDAENNDSGRHK